MAYLNNVRDGRKSKVYLLSPSSTAVASGFVKGKLYVYAKKDSSAPAFAGINQGDFFFFNKAADPTLGTNDVIYEVTPKFLGGATDKDISFEKSTTDITADKDASTNITSSGVVSSSGSITAYSLIQTGDTAANLIKKRFNNMVTYDSSGVPTSDGSDRTEKDLLMFVWDARELGTGEYVEVDFVPAFLSSLAHGSAYGSGQTFTINFSGADTNELGYRRSNQQFEYFTEFGTQLAAWETA